MMKVGNDHNISTLIAYLLASICRDSEAPAVIIVLVGLGGSDLNAHLDVREPITSQKTTFFATTLSDRPSRERKLSSNAFL